MNIHSCGQVRAGSGKLTTGYLSKHSCKTSLSNTRCVGNKHRGKLRQRSFSSQGWVWVTKEHYQKCSVSSLLFKVWSLDQQHQHHPRVVSNPESQIAHMLLRIYILSRPLGDLGKTRALVDSVVIRINLSNFSTYWHVPRWSLSVLHVLQSHFSKSHF